MNATGIDLHTMKKSAFSEKLKDKPNEIANDFAAKVKLPLIYVPYQYCKIIKNKQL